jgi:hypothetical protein
VTQVAAYFTGIALPKAAIVPRSLGFLPNPMVLIALPQTGPIPAGGTLVLQHAATTLTLNDVKVDFATIHMTTRGHVMVIRLLDRRWRWKFFHISGRYNVRQADGTIDPATQQSVQQLATLLLNSMFEVSFDVSALPTNIYPRVNWDYNNSSVELSRMLESLGFDICLNLNDTVSIVQLGVGAGLPINTDLQDAELTADPPEGPDKLLLVCGETQFQSRLTLEAVGEDSTGEIKLIADCDWFSYVPAGGIIDNAFFEDMRNNGATAEQIHLARKTAYRWYQVKEQSDGTLNVPVYGAIADIKQILPINTWLLESYTSAVGDRKTDKPARVYGTFLLPADPLDDVNSDPCTLYEGDFQIDRFNGIVKFKNRVQKRNGSTKALEAATLYLETSYGVQVNTTLGILRETFEYVFNPGVLTEVIRAEELGLKVIAAYDDGACTAVASTSSNLASLTADAQEILAAAALRYTSAVYASGVYRGLQPINPDGAIQQVVFTCDDNKGANTRASYNTESATGVLRRKQRRRRRIAEENADVDSRRLISQVQHDRGWTR